ncbi:MAG: GMP reductase [Candidatus Woesearchaeota archaeon]
MRIDSDMKLDFKDVLIRPKRSTMTTRKNVTLERTFKFRHSGKQWTGIPIMPANMDTTGTIEMADALSKHKMMTALHKHYSVEEFANIFNSRPIDFFDNIFYSIGTNENDYKKLHEVISKIDNPEKIKNICIDVANGYSETFIDFIRKVRKDFPEKTIMAGNVVTGEMVEALIIAGADIVKIGIGPGSVCTTRVMTGVGYPQLSAIIECADAAHGMGAQICSDGGLTIPGEFGKAFGAGADFIMSGHFFAGTDESAGEIIEQDGKKFKKYYGMSSDTAMNKYNGGVAEYRASEGKTVYVAYKGPVDHIIQQVLGGLRSTCTYVGASRLKDLSKCTTFVRVTQQYNEVFGKSY